MAGRERKGPPAEAGRTPTTFLLLRHAESEANAGGFFGSQTDSPLTARGRAQALALDEAMASLRIDAVLSSDLSRAHDTVLPLAARRGLTVRTTPLLRERHLGLLTGRTFADAEREHPELWLAMRRRVLDARPPEGESYLDLAARVAPLVDELVAEFAEKTVAIGSHGGTLQAVARHLLGLRGERGELWLSVGNASVTRVDLQRHDDGTLAPRLVYANRQLPEAEHGHFD